MITKHKPICWVVTLLLVVGGINWGLVGLGMLMGNDLNVVNMLLGTWPMVEAVVYLLVGISALMFGSIFCKMKNCTCNK